MTSIAENMRLVLDQASRFSIRPTPAMRARDAAAKALRRDLAGSLGAAAAEVNVASASELI
jgi:hypothetical protein